MPDDDWTQSNARRLELCDKLFDVGLTLDEERELDRLQVEAGRRTKPPWRVLEDAEAVATREGLLPPTN